MSWNLQHAVGLNNDGSFCPNRLLDQQQVAELLGMIPLSAGGIKGGLPVIDIPPFTDGVISEELVAAIQHFQTINSAVLNIDRRIEPNSPAWLSLVALATGTSIVIPSPATVILLDPINLVMEDGPPIPASGLPSFIYSPAKKDVQLVFDDGRLRIEMLFSGLLSVSWGGTFNLACKASPSFSELDKALKSGNARNVEATVLDGLCKELEFETKAAVHELFSGVKISIDSMGIFKVSGSVGDEWRQLSVGFEAPSTIFSKGRLKIEKPVQLLKFGGEVKISGTLSVELKCTLNSGSLLDQASIVPSLIALGIAGGFVLIPVATWITEAGAIEGAIEVGFEGLKALRIIMGPVPVVVR
ncbi:MAG: hypothetical protein KF722_15995 [Nitrospira sp.]|nr:hypothetical protein [Nitrospira sp.]